MQLREVIGQNVATRLLRRLIATGRLPHALLLDGIPGSGRRTLATALTQALLCQAPQEGDACGICSSCRLVLAGTHPDLVSTPHESQGDELGVEEVRDLIADAVYQSPLLGSKRVFILHAIERFHGAASNTLLKVLEEPPSGVYLVMTTSRSSAVLRTIRSRAQLVRLLPQGAADLERILERAGVDAVQARARAVQGGGSHRGLWQESGTAPLRPMRQLCEKGLDPALVMEVVEQLPRRASDDTGRSLLAEQRHVLDQWLTALIHDLRPGLRSPEGQRYAALIERVIALQHDVQVNINPHAIIEGLALATA